MDGASWIAIGLCVRMCCASREIESVFEHLGLPYQQQVLKAVTPEPIHIPQELPISSCRRRPELRPIRREGLHLKFPACTNNPRNASFSRARSPTQWHSTMRICGLPLTASKNALPKRSVLSVPRIVFCVEGTNVVLSVGPSAGEKRGRNSPAGMSDCRARQRSNKSLQALMWFAIT
ncbi:hypothetical protein B0H10DRAFT_632428 [Mycena sp. CBHHK59/15]|nr:hypothetical protein B0H10DRAFT_632428 [Mycena sp. CBHHK59/15]